VSVVLNADTLDAVQRDVLDYDRDVVRLGVQRIPDQLDKGLDWPVAAARRRTRSSLASMWSCRLDAVCRIEPTVLLCSRSVLGLVQHVQRNGPVR
jgi:hypothetical protein